ncbi:hypothetical protein ACFL5B_00300 [Candidatus Latescibacterota bacterium]
MLKFYLSDSLTTITRRELLGMPLTLVLTGITKNGKATERKRIAAIITSYWPGSHADCIAGAMLNGYPYYDKHLEPSVQIISMYTDQVPDNDMSRYLALKHHYSIFPTIREALTLGGRDLAVDGVLLIGEHGDYAYNIKGQQLYPRYYFYKQIIDVFRETGRVIPIFFDKHFSYDWNEAKWIYDQARELKIPMLAGSSLPLTWRRPPLELDLETPVEKAVFVSYGAKERSGIHSLLSLQSMVERRKGGETGIAAVKCLEGAPVWEWTDGNSWAERLLENALARCPKRKPGSPRDNVKNPIVFVLEYLDGLKAAVYMLSGHIRQNGFAADIRGKNGPISTQFWTQHVRPWGHAFPLYFHIEHLMNTGQPSWPIERELLATGTLAALFDSSFQDGRIVKKGHRLETPHLKIAYHAPQKSLFYQGPVPSREEKLWINIPGKVYSGTP